MSRPYDIADDLRSAKRRRSIEKENRRSPSAERRDSRPMQKRGRSSHVADLYDPAGDRLRAAYKYYETKWVIPSDERLLTRKEFEDISNQIHSCDPAHIVNSARDWNYFLPPRPKPAPARPRVDRPAAPASEPSPTPARIPIPKTPAAPEAMTPTGPRAEQHTLPPKPAEKTEDPLIKPDTAIDDAFRIAIQRKADRDQAFLRQAKKDFVAEVVKLHEKIPKLAVIFTKSDAPNIAQLGSKEQPGCFDKETVTACLRLLTDYEDKVMGGYEKQMQVAEYLRGYTIFGDIVKETDRLAKMYTPLRNSTAEARGLLGDMMLIMKEASRGQTNGQQKGENEEWA